MTTTSRLSDYLPYKRQYLSDPDRPQPTGAPLTASVTTEGRAGVRKIRIRDHQIISDSGVAGGGSDFGPIPGELAIAALGGCLSHGWIMQAALAGITLDYLRIDVSTASAPDDSGAPASLEYSVTVESDASPEKLDEILDLVAQKSWVHRLLVNPVEIRGTLTSVATEGATR